MDAIEASVLQDRVHMLKIKAPVTVPVDAPLGLALHRMVDHGVGALLVVDAAGRLVGILTERDYLRKVVGTLADYAHQPLQDFMTSEPETVRPDDKLALVLEKMDVGGYRHLPVVEEDGVPVGLVSVRDAIRHITRLCGSGR
ncbi:MAG TPA: CBS domain-containing protein [Gemmataceae bacterium]|jgi:CBS domain-containing protein|nr:CBS domain-containing protein [Gemmataceae bacterium]